MRVLTEKFQKRAAFGLILAAAAIALLPLGAQADNYGDRAVFNVDKRYDAAGRNQAAAVLVWSGEKIYFYVDEAWWNKIESWERQRYNAAFSGLDGEFSRHIRPKLTEMFGESSYGNFARDGKLTVLIHPMIKDAGGYINTGDGYSKYQAPGSNEREMIYFNTLFVDSPLAKVYLAHEYMHLITFNQKERLRHAVEEVWLNEVRAEYSSTILGYDDSFAGSNFEQRVKSFAADANKSLAEWQNVTANYGAAHLWAQYIVDHYGIAIFTDSMKTEKIGIASIEHALAKNGVDASFAQIFRDWLIALAVNDCSLGERYCYKYVPLKGFVIAPKINYLPASDQVSLSVAHNTPYFAGNWQKIMGARGNLRLDFESAAAHKFIAPYVLCEASGKCAIGELETAADGNAMMILENFGEKYVSLTLMPFAAGKTFGFDHGNQNPLPYSFRAAVSSKTAPPPIAGGEDEDKKIQTLLAQIEALKKEIARVQMILAARVAAPLPAPKFSCAKINVDLHSGIQSRDQIICLQEFLKSQGGLIYPGGIITGNFDAATRAAVIRFQEKHAVEILAPLGLATGTGYVGAATRAKINQILETS